MSASLAVALGSTSYSFLKSERIVLAVNTPTPTPNDGETITVYTSYNQIEKEQVVSTVTRTADRSDNVTTFYDYNADGSFNSSRTITDTVVNTTTTLDDGRTNLTQEYIGNNYYYTLWFLYKEVTLADGSVQDTVNMYTNGVASGNLIETKGTWTDGSTWDNVMTTNVNGVKLTNSTVVTQNVNGNITIKTYGDNNV